MEPTKNNNQSAGGSSEPAFQGMPKPGQPLAPTPTFSAHTPSAIDRILNPNISSESVDNYVHGATSKTVTNSASSASPIASNNPVNNSGAFKPYTPPTTVSSPSVSPSPIFPKTAPTAPVAQASGYKVGTSMGQTQGFSSNNPPPIHTPNKVSNTRTPISNPITNPTPLSSQQIIVKKKNPIVLWSIVAVVILLLIGGGYYWYAFMYQPSQSSVNDENSNTGSQNGANSNGASNSGSLFPTGVARPAIPAGSVSNTSPVRNPIPTTPTRVTTPFTSAQRDSVRAYIYANINSLSSVPSSVPFEVTDVTFDGPDRAIVDFTNGKASYTAIAVANIDTAGVVRVTSFALLEK